MQALKIPLTAPAKPSSQVEAHGFDPATSTLALQFKNPKAGESGVYHYDSFPATQYDALRNADSVGSFVAREVKSKFQGVKQPQYGAA